MIFAIGIALEKEEFKVAVLKKEKNTLSIHSLHSFPYSPDSVKLFYSLPPFSTKEETLVVSGLPSSALFMRKLHIPLKEKRKVLAALPFQLESLIPLSSEAPIIYTVLGRLGKQMTSVTVMATTKEILSSHIQLLKEIEIYPDVLSCAQTALMRFARQKHPEEKRLLIFDVRDQKLSCVVCEGKELIISQTLSSCDSADLEKLAIFLKQKGAIDDTTPWMLTGQLNVQEQLSSFFLGKKLDVDTQNAAFSISIGLALDALHADDCSVQFCQKEFLPNQTLQRRKTRILSYITLCASAAFLMMLSGSLMLGKKERLLKEHLQEYLPHSLAKNPPSSIEEIEEKLSDWEKSLKGKKNTFAYLPNVPKVSDVLAWLSTHPALSHKEGEAKEEIEIKSLHYCLTTYPKIGQTSSAYTAELELELFSKTPRAARDFHDALLKADPMINLKKEVKWHTQNQTYTTSFELNKRAPQ